MSTTTQASESFGHIAPGQKALLRPDEAADILGRSVHHIYALIEEGKLEAHAPQDRQVRRYRVTRRSVLLYLAETATTSPSRHVERICRLVGTLDKSGAAKVREAAQKRYEETWE